jgi:hypothetical protein
MAHFTNNQASKIKDLSKVTIEKLYVDWIYLHISGTVTTEKLCADWIYLHISGKVTTEKLCADWIYLHISVNPLLNFQIACLNSNL